MRPSVLVLLVLALLSSPCLEARRLPRRSLPLRSGRDEQADETGISFTEPQAASRSAGARSLHALTAMDTSGGSGPEYHEWQGWAAVPLSR